jgi:hypothetical protein
MILKLLQAFCIFLFICIPLSVNAQNAKIGDESDGSRAIPLHLIKLIDQDSSVIRPGEYPLLPFSTEKTCGACHDYKKVRTGWHFNAGDSAAHDGRPGQPWIYVDAYSGTQIPLSQRNWQGTFKPDEIGMDNLEFVTQFGRQMPGGGVGDNEKAHSLDNYLRWRVRGNLEINCLSCHDAEKTHHQVEYANNIAKQNFRWAATASAGFAWVEGSATDLPDNYDIYAGINPQQSQALTPRVTYDERRFNKKGEVFFDIVRKIPNERCYFCHSTKWVDKSRQERWHMEDDVHISSGMLCVDCHRNGLDHNMVRGSEKDDPHAMSLTCAGCHVPQANEQGRPVNGRLGAPVPQHQGLPPIHFEKLACTTCHSGNWPQDKNIFAKTSMAHRLGLHNSNKNNQALPHIITPVFARTAEGRYAPHNMIWPSYWGEMDSTGIVPLKMDVFLPVARKIIAQVDSLATNDWPDMSDSTLICVLDSLYKSQMLNNPPVYISAGRVFYLDKQKQLKSIRDSSAKAYLWPIAHDVRPAEQSLGINGCTDCHSPASNFAMADIDVDSPLLSARKIISMSTFLDQNIVYENVFASTFYLRPLFKYLLLLSLCILMAIALIYGLKGFKHILIYISSHTIAGDGK